MLRMAIGLTAVLAPLQVLIGDQHGLSTLKHQPTKIAAMEAHWTARSPATSTSSPGRTRRPEKKLFRNFDSARSSLILTHDWNGLFPGLKDVRRRSARRWCRCFFCLPHHAGDRLLHGGFGALTGHSCGGAARCSKRAGICG